MKNTIWKSAGLAALLALGLTTLASPNALSVQGNGGRLAGTWDVRVTPRDCISGVESPSSFAELVTFNTGGTMLDSTSRLSPALKTPGQGVWTHVSGDTYRFKFKILNFNGTTFSGWTIVTHELDLDSTANEYTSVGRAEVFDTNGGLTNTLCSSTAATRFE